MTRLLAPRSCKKSTLTRTSTVGPKLRAMFSWNNAEAKDKDETESFNGKIARTQVQ